MRWDRRAPGFIEVWYATITHARTGAGSLRGAHLEFGRRDSFVELPVALQ